jgi:hypothetical protein
MHGASRIDPRPTFSANKGYAMTRRAKIITVGAVLAAGAALWLFVFPNPGHGINRRNFRLIRVGMTEGEISNLLRVPPGHYATTHGTGDIGHVDLESFPRGAKQPEGGTMKDWIAEDCGISVVFDREGKAYLVMYVKYPQNSTSIFNWLRRTLGLS